MNESTIQKVFPLRTAPSQIIASKFRYFELLLHHESTLNCFCEKGLIFSLITSHRLCALVYCVKKTLHAVFFLLLAFKLFKRL